MPALSTLVTEKGGRSVRQSGWRQAKKKNRQQSTAEATAVRSRQGSAVTHRCTEAPPDGGRRAPGRAQCNAVRLPRPAPTGQGGRRRSAPALRCARRRRTRTRMYRAQAAGEARKPLWSARSPGPGPSAPALDVAEGSAGRSLTEKKNRILSLMDRPGNRGKPATPRHAQSHLWVLNVRPAQAFHRCWEMRQVERSGHRGSFYQCGIHGQDANVHRPRCKCEPPPAHHGLFGQRTAGVGVGGGPVGSLNQGWFLSLT